MQLLVNWPDGQKEGNSKITYGTENLWFDSGDEQTRCRDAHLQSQCFLLQFLTRFGVNIT